MLGAGPLVLEPRARSSTVVCKLHRGPSGCCLCRCMAKLHGGPSGCSQRVLPRCLSREYRQIGGFLRKLPFRLRRISACLVSSWGPAERVNWLRRISACLVSSWGPAMHLLAARSRWSSTASGEPTPQEPGFCADQLELCHAPIAESPPHDSGLPAFRDQRACRVPTATVAGTASCPVQEAHSTTSRHGETDRSTPALPLSEPTGR